MKTFTFATGTNFEESRAQTLFWGDAEPLVGRVLLFAGQNRTRRCEAIGRDSFYLHVFLKLHVDRPGRQINDRRLTKLKYFRNSNVSPTKAALLRPSGISLFNDKYGRNFAVRTLLFSFFWPVWGIPLILLLNKGVYTASANWPGPCFSSPAQQLSNNILQTFHLTLVWESKQRALCVPLQEEEFLFWEALKRCAVVDSVSLFSTQRWMGCSGGQTEPRYGLCIRQKSRLTAVINELYGQLQGLKNLIIRQLGQLLIREGKKRKQNFFFPVIEPESIFQFP